MMDERDSHIPNERPENSRFDPGLKNTYKGLKPTRKALGFEREHSLKNTYKGLKHVHEREAEEGLEV
jgi:hypothetical protein